MKQSIKTYQVRKTILTTIGVVLLSLSSQAQNSQYGVIEEFFMANPDLPDASQYVSRIVNPNYLLVNWSQRTDMDQRMISDNCVRLGISSWISDNAYGGGIPQKGLAIAYARAIGAQFIIYTSRQSPNEFNRSEHLVSFYSRQAGRAESVAKPSQISNAQATIAINWLQDSLGKPRVRSVWYDAASDSFCWIGPKYGKQMSMPRGQFLDEVWAGYIKANPDT
jgi:hypothetical protein